MSDVNVWPDSWEAGYEDGFHAATFGDDHAYEETVVDPDSEYVHGYDAGYEDGLRSLVP